MRYMIPIVFLILFGNINTLVSQSALSTELNAHFTDYNVDEIPSSKLFQKVKNTSEFQDLKLSLGDKIFELEVWNSGLINENMQVTLASGRTAKHAHPIALKGSIKGNTASSVRLTINDGFIYGNIFDGKKRLNIQPAHYFDSSADKDLFVSYYNKDMIPSRTNHTCGVGAHMKKTPKLPVPTRPKNKRIGECFEVEIALAADWLMFEDYGSEAAVENQIAGVLNDVQGNYDDEFADVIEYDLSDVWISDCSTCDPWTSSTDAGAFLNDFTSWAPSNLSGHQVASLWTSRNFDGTTIGLAWVGTVCTSLCYNVLEDFTNNASFLRVLQAHELGHNWDALHDSGNTFIMSESVTTSTSWSSDSMNAIESYATNFSSCFGSCSSGNPPEAFFEYDIISSCVVGEVEFTDLSTLAGEWLWTFEGGSPGTSTEQNPIVNYQFAGTYDVTLEVTNAAGDDEIQLSNIIQISDGPVAFFEHENYELEVDFYDESGAASNAGHYWNFGDGNESTDQNPTHAYFMPGTYTVTFEVEDDCGSDELTMEIEVFDQPESDFTANTLMVCPGENVDFTDQSYGGVETWAWNFNGGTADDVNIQNPTVSFDSPGIYTVSLMISNPEGSDTKTKQNYIQVLDNPQANFTTSINNALVTFTNNSTSASTYLWNFGDGNTSTDMSPTHTYASSGDYQVMLEATNDCSTDTNTQLVSISLQPIADFSTNIPPTGCADLNLNFTDNSLGTPTSWSWSFPGASPSSSSLQNPTVTYSEKGTFPVTLTATNSFGTDVIEKIDYVTIDDVPILTTNYTRNILTVSFMSTLSNGSGVMWDFGDGNTSTLANPVHTYMTPGTYTVTTVSSNPCGTVTETLTVSANSLPTANLTISNSNICLGESVTYSDTSTGDVSSREWTFTGGSPATSTLAIPVVNYPSTGTYAVTLVVHNNTGSDTLTLTQAVTVDAAPVLSASFTRSELTASFMSTLENSNNLLWDFGDGNTSPLANPVHSYASPGAYNVSLTSSNSCGTDTENLTVTVNSLPSANFAADATTVCIGTPIQYTDLSGSDVISRQWLFPGGSPATSTLANPVVNYDNSGSYDVTLIITNDTGTDTQTFTNYVEVQAAPEALYEITQSDNQINLTNTSTNASSVSWVISDGRSFSGSPLSVTFSENGDYTIVQEVSNNCGSDQNSFTVTIAVFPESDFTSSTMGGCSPLSVNYMSSASAAETHLWTFPGGNPASSSDPNPVVVYQQEGQFNATLQVTNAFGTSSQTLDNYITISSPPALSYELEQNGNTFILTNTSVGAMGSWIINDGTMSNENTLEHSFEANGIYEVNLLVTNSCGSEEETFEVVVDVFPTPAISTDNSIGCTPFTVSYQDQSAGMDHSYQWSFEGGNPASSTEVNPTVVYENPGIFDVDLELTNSLGLSWTETKVDMIVVADIPLIDFDVNMEEATVTIINNSVGATSYSWDFGDGNTSIDPAPMHTYEASGSYEITLTAENECGFIESSFRIEIDIISATDDTGFSNKWNIAPNPSTGEFNIYHDSQLVGEWKYSVIDLRGITILEGQIENNLESQSLFIEESGVYLIMLSNGTHREVRRQVIIR